MTSTFNLSAPVQNLLDQFQKEMAPKQIILQEKESQFPATMLDPEESQMILTKTGDIELFVPNPRFANFIVAHELMHLQQEGRQSVQISYVKQNNPQFSQFLDQIGQELRNIVVHQAMHQQLLELGVLDDDVQQAIQKLIDEKLPVDDSTTSALVIAMKAIQLADTFTFVGSVDQWQEKFAKSMKVAAELWQLVTTANLTTNRQVRALIDQLINYFAEYFDKFGLQVPSLADNLLLKPVLSERQLKLSVRQLFQLWRQPNAATTYLVKGIQDEQAISLIEIPKDEQQEAAMLAIYDLSVQAFLDKFALNYAPRDLPVFPEDEQ
ncbi:hypothetical protein FC84_GL000497 [Lapidilactobacillus dextrinicus DSM 20335]|uniref:IpaB EvcA family protein n=1 Tax=Lapidilactobacillus dextrinicus DSM 20335 TaxID=1423738 RepID=A0A0R2BTU3_9LACO|nr:hypothetical protein [Lapidilactobacillus dextrinicus]KRM79801.1 hypothetical protein FC84_GL000497 [Lapidilactobacillus dextrinicus DSM 20335]QFG46413.1 hypothetical protein LH506_02590 [Lapidilactobacillus dextrinicus]